MLYMVCGKYHIRHSIYHILLEYKVVKTEAPKTLEQAPLAIFLKYRNINLLSIGYAFRPDLRTD